ncbi:hypothetical protein LMH87_002748 [Akanthomyces muscarius]|uniref:HIT domain-containing protein n=1 Tax=Akanthomyces muscarius TaxID=2231603 RepID=A0A9W8UJR7_AKAMU|nr:hypothetical protein LMH87_002748 [Akanthomyces muscarius]KAJ4148269.1 hypothetical protein LMH87_002748 [Akanthomyces muscarius]
MEAIRRLYNYLTGLYCTERFQNECVFCDRANFANILYEDDKIIAIDSLRPAGQYHWLILPKVHAVRDIEGLNRQHIGLLQAMDRVKKQLVREKCQGISPSAIMSGYHRGRRQLLGNIFWPDIISIRHLHLHVIVRPHLVPWLFKYPPWLPLMWKSDTRVLKETQLLLSSTGCIT